MMQDQLKIRADKRRRTLIKRADFPQLKYMADLIVEELPEDARAALPLMQSLDFIRQDAISCCTVTPELARHISRPPWESRPARME